MKCKDILRTLVVLIAVCHLLSCSCYQSLVGSDGGDADSGLDGGHDGSSYCSSLLDCIAGGVPEGAELIDEVAVKGYISDYKNYNSEPAIAVDGCCIHVVWIDTDRMAIVYVRSEDFGSTWTNEDLISSGIAPVDFRVKPSIQIDVYGNNIFVLWQMSEENRVNFVRSPNNGLDWSDAQELGRVHTSIAQATDDNGSVFSIWNSEKIFCSRTDDFGINWDSPTVLVDLKGEFVTYISMDASSKMKHLLWWTMILDNQEITQKVGYSNTGLGCGDWMAPVYVGEVQQLGDVPNTFGDVFPAVDARENKVHIVWSEIPTDLTIENRTISYRRSDDGGKTFGLIKKLSPNDGSRLVTGKDIATSGSAIHVVTNVGYFRSLNEGDDWSDVMPIRAGSSIDTSMGWTIIVGSDQNGIYWVRFPEGQ